ncbi:class III heat-shock ATP-dependent LonA protease [Petrocella atlantisensis]|uniref:Lon protease n=1 Tax=Petrocella atlantisensis TaxID=2173034 RepID=A0A3P7RXK6_9FIRM|nr:endopeptidase La [Petrocella atlantisensis]VDN47372.1 class III heat-shock ATP-dependent LonA protease [Petrocella atlantisensis]
MTEHAIILPVLPLRGINLFPNTIMHFDVKRDKSVKALDQAMLEGQMIFLVAQKQAHVEEPGIVEDMYKDGTITKIKQLIKLPNKIVRVLVEGISRGRIVNFTDQTSYLEANIEKIELLEVPISTEEEEAMRRIAFESIHDYEKVNPNFSKETLNNIRRIKYIGEMTDNIAFNLMTSLSNKQSILGEIEVKSRFKLAISMLNAEVEIMKLKNNINNQVKQKIDQNQKEYFLREQLKVIQTELGDQQEIEDEVSEYMEAVDNLNASEEIKERLYKELKRLKRMSASSAEGSVIRSYIECILEMPWNEKTIESTDIEGARDILDEDHYGLEKVKERIIEHLAVRKIAQKTDSPIICLVGPPGTGKTSIAKSVARALNRHYARISLGGVRDEADIRGHRKTYIGAMPGRIVNALKQAKTSNPLILLDEMDKMSSDMRGNPSAALLEVLDGEQNDKFRDHYVEMNVDLSDVLFIGTANTLRTIPRPLMDRLEIIEVHSYTVNEKVHIAKSHLIKKQLDKHGLSASQLKFSDKALMEMINSYTKEAGVRNLERKIGEICRKVAKEIVIGEKKRVQITEKNIKKYLGITLFHYDKRCDEPQIGVVRGLAWTEVGGDTLSIEVNVMPGTGKFEITGQIGDVMKESARAAISYTRSISGSHNIDKVFYTNKDIHIHIPQGAVPKDGPSAGITLATAIISALSGIKVHNKVAMTGEITLRGRVLPIGGLKEKLLAAKRAGIEKVLIPIDNKRDIEKISEEILTGLTIIYVRNMDEVLKEALIKETKDASK